MAKGQQQQPAATQRTSVVELKRHQSGLIAQLGEQLVSYREQFADVLPPNVSFDLFRRTLMTACATNPDLLYADRRSLFVACSKSAADGLLPDGRQAVLLPFNTEVKLRDPNTGLDNKVRVDLVQYIPMVAGIRERIYRTGQVLTVETDLVCKNDSFRYRRGDDPLIEHEPPPLGEERGEIVGAYAIISLANGTKIREVMSRADIDKVKLGLRHKGDTPLWRDHYGEACRKTVLRRAGKSAPQSAIDYVFTRMLERDDELPELPDEHTMRLGAPEPEPTPPARRAISPPAAEPQVDDNPEPEYPIVDLDGVETICANSQVAESTLMLIIENAGRVSPAQLAGAWESNATVIAQLGDEATQRLGEHYREVLGRFQQPAARNAAAGAARVEQQQQAPRAAIPTAEPLGRPQESEAPGGGNGAPKAEPPHAAPPPATGQPVLQEDRQSKAIPIEGRDAKTWAIVLFPSQLRRCTTTPDLAHFLGDNEENLQAVRGKLSKSDNADLDAAIKEQWRLVDLAEGKAS